MRKFLLLSLLCVSALGCSSARSTLIERSESDECWKAERLLHGVPITVQVPTHIRVDITEHRYLQMLIDSEIGWVEAESLYAPERTVSTELVKTSKIFTVDPKRPAAGTIDSTLKFGGKNGQYFDQIDYDVDDKTIAAITTLIGKVAPAGLFGRPTNEGSRNVASIDESVHRVDNVVASSIFSLDAPDVELQISEFLEAHLNSCHDCNVSRQIVR